MRPTVRRGQTELTKFSKALDPRVVSKLHKIIRARRNLTQTWASHATLLVA